MSSTRPALCFSMEEEEVEGRTYGTCGFGDAEDEAALHGMEEWQDVRGWSHCEGSE